MSRAGWCFCGAALASLLALGEGSAQSLMNAGGLGVPLDAVDARARALGGVGTGLLGPVVSPTDPAAAADQTLSSISLTLAGSWVDVHEGGTSSSASGTRFPVLAVSYPARTWGTASLTFGGVLDQRWRVRQERDIPLDQGTARVTDTFLSDGGLSALRFGFARRFSPNLALGASVGTYTGKVTRRFTRTFDSLDVDTEVPAFDIGGLWSYSGYTATLGSIVDVAGTLRLSASVTWSGKLEAEPSEDTPGARGTFDLPLELRTGLSGVLAPGLVASLGLMWADWSDAGETLESASGRSAVTVGGGVEWTQASLLGRTTPLRVGYRRSTLPFTFGEEGASESAFSAGAGINLVEQQEVPLARADLAFERGRREAGSVSEDFMRLSLTLRVSGF